jgi:hypothetical protein
MKTINVNVPALVICIYILYIDGLADCMCLYVYVCVMVCVCVLHVANLQSVTVSPSFKFLSSLKLCHVCQNKPTCLLFTPNECVINLITFNPLRQFLKE